mmetsp:Transcript_968/g.3585  ORF Transcript_968/g.3585 Transcript_968/m.3585 type:complete len:347 (+) Transcript_968:60-1100(+)
MIIFFRRTMIKSKSSSPRRVRAVPAFSARRHAHELVEVVHVHVAARPPFLALVKHGRSRMIRARVVGVFRFHVPSAAPRVATRPGLERVHVLGHVSVHVSVHVACRSCARRERRVDVRRLRLRARRVVAAEEALGASRAPRLGRRISFITCTSGAVFPLRRARLDGEGQRDGRRASVRGGVGGRRRACHLGFHLGVPPHRAPLYLHEERKVVRSRAAARPLLGPVVEHGRARVVAAASGRVTAQGVVDDVAADALAHVRPVRARRGRQRATVHVLRGGLRAVVVAIAIGRLHASRAKERADLRLAPSEVRVLGRRRTRRMRVRQHLHQVRAPHRVIGHPAGHGASH